MFSVNYSQLEDKDSCQLVNRIQENEAEVNPDMHITGLHMGGGGGS